MYVCVCIVCVCVLCMSWWCVRAPRARAHARTHVYRYACVSVRVLCVYGVYLYGVCECHLIARAFDNRLLHVRFDLLLRHKGGQS